MPTTIEQAIDEYRENVTASTHRPSSNPQPLVCQNCGQWVHGKDCLNECAARGFAVH